MNYEKLKKLKEDKLKRLYEKRAKWRRKDYYEMKSDRRRMQCSSMLCYNVVLFDCEILF